MSFNFGGLPRELRCIIYVQYFLCIRLTFGKVYMTGSYRPVVMQPARNSLALLETCRGIRADIGERWMSLVLWNFEDIDTMMDRLSVMAANKLKLIRFLRVRATLHDRFVVGEPHRRIFRIGFRYSLAHYLILLPALRVRTLTILDDTLAEQGEGRPNVSGLSLESLRIFMKYSCGWEQLKVIFKGRQVPYAGGYPEEVPADAMDEDLVEPRTTPFDWLTELEARGDPNSNPSLENFKAIPGTVEFEKASIDEIWPPRKPSVGQGFQDGGWPEEAQGPVQMLVVNRGKFTKEAYADLQSRMLKDQQMQTELNWEQSWGAVRSHYSACALSLIANQRWYALDRQAEEIALRRRNMTYNSSRAQQSAADADDEDDEGDENDEEDGTSDEDGDDDDDEWLEVMNSASSDEEEEEAVPREEQSERTGDPILVHSRDLVANVDYLWNEMQFRSQHGNLIPFVDEYEARDDYELGPVAFRPHSRQPVPVRPLVLSLSMWSHRS